MSDIVGEDYNLSVSGRTVTATGISKFISEPWTEFSDTHNTGHFGVVQVPAELKGQKLVLGGRTDGDRTIEKMDDDLLLVTRLENLTAAQKLTVSKDGALYMTVDYSGVKQTVPATVLPQEHNLGKFGKIVSALVGPDVVINPDNTVTGQFKYIKEWTENHDKSGYFLPIRFGGEYKDKTKKVGSNTAADEDWIIGVTKDSEVEVEIDGVKFGPLTFKSASFDPES